MCIRDRRLGHGAGDGRLALDAAGGAAVLCRPARHSRRLLPGGAHRDVYKRQDKCRYVVEELGFDACIDHRDPAMANLLAKAVPQGIDVYFENVGGAVFDAVLPLLNPRARVPVCGLISAYNATSLPDGPDRLPLLMRTILTLSLIHISKVSASG